MGFPARLAKFELVFSTGSFMVTKMRNRSGTARVESLLVLKEIRPEILSPRSTIFDEYADYEDSSDDDFEVIIHDNI